MGNPTKVHVSQTLPDSADQVRHLPTIPQAARRLLNALESLTAGSEQPGFAGWENGRGESVGDEVESARHELRAVLDLRRPQLQKMLTVADFEIEAFENVWQSNAVQVAGRSFGQRGVAEAVWNGQAVHVHALTEVNVALLAHLRATVAELGDCCGQSDDPGQACGVWRAALGYLADLDREPGNA